MKSVLCAICCLAIIKSHAQNDKEDAKNFFKKVVSNYFDSSFTIGNYLNDSVIMINPQVDTVLEDNIIKKGIDDNKKDFKEKVKNWVKPLKNAEDYFNNFKIYVYSKREFTSDSNKVIAKDAIANNLGNSFALDITSHFKKHYTDDDYFVFGDVPSSKTSPNIYGLFFMVVRKTNKGWKISGITF